MREERKAIALLLLKGEEGLSSVFIGNNNLRSYFIFIMVKIKTLK